MASRAAARPVAVDLSAGRADTAALFDAVGERTRVLVLCNPNDPTGSYLAADEVRRLAAALPEHVQLLVDEAYIQFQDVEPEDSVLRLVDELEHVTVFRTFSKIYGISGLRCGYAVGSQGAGRLLDAIAPALGVNALTQAAVEYALRFGDDEIGRRRDLVIEQRRRLERVLHELPVDAPESQANFLWLHATGLTGAQLATHLDQQGVTVANGSALGADDHIRASIRGRAATDRLLEALAATRPA
jgi:histidinol-phosphate aminotransferase